MPTSFRKSKSLGPVRMTASKSGVTTSVGVKGARLGIGPRGTYVHLGRGGVSYRQPISAPTRPARTQNASSEPSGDDQPDDEQFADVSGDAVLEQLNSPSGSWLARLLGRTKPVVLSYSLENEAGQRFALAQQAISALAEAQQVWQVDHREATADRKHHGGATSTVHRHGVAVGMLATPGIETNIEVVGIDTGRERYLFFPDRIFIRRGKRYSAIPYDGLHAAYSSIRFNEEERLPPDTQIVGQTWRYVNKSGGPDKRFKDNRQIPIVLYGNVAITSTSGLQLVFQTSTATKAQQCANLVNSLSGNPRR